MKASQGHIGEIKNGYMLTFKLKLDLKLWLVAEIINSPLGDQWFWISGRFSRGVNRFADRRIWPFFTPGLRILAIN